ncbi:MAG: tripartite tricarboxylate transporter substrate-binding protein [Pseudomonadota bacterium]
MMSAIRWTVLAAIVWAGPLMLQPAQAADYPTKPIKLIAAYPAGGGVDVMARVFGAALGERLKQSVIVENKPGASGMIGTEYVAKAPPDGYTLLLARRIPIRSIPASTRTSVTTPSATSSPSP